MLCTRPAGDLDRCGEGRNGGVEGLGGRDVEGHEVRLIALVAEFYGWD